MKNKLKKTIGIIVPNLKEITSILTRLAPPAYLIKFIPESGVKRRQVLETIDSLIYFPGTFDQKDKAYSKKLKFVQFLTAGVDGFDLGGLKNKGVLIADNNGTNSTAVAEHTIMLILSVMKRLPTLHNNVLYGKWRSPPPKISNLSQLEGKTVGIIGLGRIGSKVAIRLLAFGCKVNFYDINKKIIANSKIKSMSTLRSLMSNSDILSFHTPLTDTTRHMLNKKTIKWCRKNVIIINTARGAIIDEKVLIKGLNENYISGLGMDVFETEPYKGALCRFANTVLTPHRAGSNIDSWNDRIKFAYKNIDSFFSNQKPEGLV